MATPSEVFTQMVSTTLRHVDRGIADNVSKHNGLYRRMKDKGKIRTVDGGYECQVPLEYAENNYQRYSGWQPWNTDATDVITSAKYDWSQAAVIVMANGRELRSNNGEAAMVKLVKAKKSNAIKTAANGMSVDVYSDGSLPNQLGGLAHIIQTNGQGTVGGINSATFPFWRNKFKEASGTNAAASPDATKSAAFKADMNQLWLPLTRGSDKPDVIVFSHDFYSLYELGEQQLQRYMDADRAEAGFAGLKYKSADVIFDDNTNFSTTAEKGYFLNTDYLYLEQFEEAKWSPDEERRPANQDGVVMPFLWQGAFVCSNRSLQGVIFDAA